MTKKDSIPHLVLHFEGEKHTKLKGANGTTRNRVMCSISTEFPEEDVDLWHQVKEKLKKGYKIHASEFHSEMIGTLQDELKSYEKKLAEVEKELARYKKFHDDLLMNTRGLVGDE